MGRDAVNALEVVDPGPRGFAPRPSWPGFLQFERNEADPGRHHLVVGGAHAIKLQLTHQCQSACKKEPRIGVQKKPPREHPFVRFSGVILPFSNRDDKGKCKTTGRTPSFLPPDHFSSSTGPQAFSRPDRRMTTPVRAGRVKTGRPGGHRRLGLDTAEHDGRLVGSGLLPSRCLQASHFIQSTLPGASFSSRSSPRSPHHGLRKASAPPCPERD